MGWMIWLYGCLAAGNGRREPCRGQQLDRDSRHGSTWRKALAFAGPGFVISVGYMDPWVNWATDLAGGSAFGYALLSVVLLSSRRPCCWGFSARLGIATGRDLAQACRDSYPAPVVLGFGSLARSPSAP